MDRIHLKCTIAPDTDEKTRNALSLFFTRTHPDVENAAGEYVADNGTVLTDQARPYLSESDQLCVDPLSLSSGEYDRICEYAKDSPMLVRRMLVSSDRAPTLKRLQYRIDRWTPFDERRSQKTPLAALMNSSQQNDMVIEVPVGGLILDGFTGLVFEASGAIEDAENFSIVLEVEAVADARASLQ